MTQGRQMPNRLVLAVKKIKLCHGESEEKWLQKQQSQTPGPVILLNNYSPKRTGTLLVLQMLKISGRTRLTTLKKKKINYNPSSAYHVVFTIFFTLFSIHGKEYYFCYNFGMKDPAEAVLWL